MQWNAKQYLVYKGCFTSEELSLYWNIKSVLFQPPHSIMPVLHYSTQRNMFYENVSFIILRVYVSAITFTMIISFTSTVVIFRILFLTLQSFYLQTCTLFNLRQILKVLTIITYWLFKKILKKIFVIQPTLCDTYEIHDLNLNYCQYYKAKNIVITYLLLT